MKPAFYIAGFWYLVIISVSVAYIQVHPLPKFYHALELRTKVSAYLSDIQRKGFTVTVRFNYQPSEISSYAQNTVIPIAISTNDLKLNVNAVLKFEL